MGAFWVAAGALGLKQGWLDVERILWLCLPATIYGALQTARKFTEYLDLQSYDPLVGTRTVVGKGLLTRLAAFVNFDIIVHGPHHRYPKAAHESLEDKMAQNQAANSQVAYPVFPSYLSAMRAMLPSLALRAGVHLDVADVQTMLAANRRRRPPPTRRRLFSMDCYSVMADRHCRQPLTARISPNESPISGNPI